MKNGTLLLQNCACYWILGSELQAQICACSGRQTSLPGCWPNDIAHILPPTSLIKFLDVTSGEAFIRGANV